MRISSDGIKLTRISSGRMEADDRLVPGIGYEAQNLVDLCARELTNPRRERSMRNIPAVTIRGGLAADDG